MFYHVQDVRIFSIPRGARDTPKSRETRETRTDRGLGCAARGVVLPKAGRDGVSHGEMTKNEKGASSETFVGPEKSLSGVNNSSGKRSF